MTVPPLTAELLDSNRIRCGAIALRHRTPIFALARRLLAEGADPAVLLTLRWASTCTVSVIEPIGKLARLDVIERDNGQRGFAAYRPREAFPSHPLPARTAPKPEPVGMTPARTRRALAA